MLQTDIKGHTSNTAMLKVWILYSLPFQKVCHFAAYITVLCVCVCVCPLASSLETTDRMSRYITKYI